MFGLLLAPSLSYLNAHTSQGSKLKVISVLTGFIKRITV